MTKQNIRLNTLRAAYGHSATVDGTVTLCTFDRALTDAKSFGIDGVLGYFASLGALKDGDVIQAAYVDGKWHIFQEGTKDIRIIANVKALRSLANHLNRKAHQEPDNSTQTWQTYTTTTSNIPTYWGAGN